MKARTNLGIRARLFLAFGAVAGMTVIASVAAWLSYSNLSDSLGRLANTHLPAMTVAAQLAETGGAIIATAPALISAADEHEQETIWTDLAVLLSRMSALLEKMEEPLVDQESRSSLQNLIGRISGNLKALDTNVDTRFTLMNRKAELMDRLQWLHADFLDEVEPMIAEAKFNIETAMAAARSSTGSPQNQTASQRLGWEMAKRDALLKINASGNRATGLLMRIANTESEEDLQFTGYLIDEIRKSLEDDLAVMQGLASSVSLRQIVFEVLSYADGNKSLLGIRSRELDVLREGRRLLAANHDLVEHLKQIIGQRVAALETATKQAASRSIQSIARGKYFLAAIATVSLAIAVLVGWIYVGRNIVARVTALGGSMRAIAEGDLKTEVPVEGRDEITEMAKALLVFRDTAIEVEEANAEAIIDNTLAGLVATNRLGVVEFFNPSAEALFGYPSSEIVGRDLTSLIHEDFRDQVADVIRQAPSGPADGHPAYLETIGLRADGTTFPMDLAFREFQQRQRVRFMVTVHDVTERTHAQELLEQRVLEKTQDLRSANRRLRQEVTKHKKTETELRTAQDELIQAGKLAALGKISAGIAHEMNQPLAAIRSYAHNGSVLIDRGRTAEARDNLERITAMTQRMADITTHLKTFARRPSKDMETVDLKTAATNALSFFENRINRESVAVDLKFPRRDLLVVAEDIRLEQVVINLLANALDAMADTPDKILRIVGRRRSGRAIMEITDTGCGIDKKNISRVFDPFYTTKEQGSGLGLGLSISSKIIRDFGGTIRAKSAPGKGATFVVSLPVATETEPTGQQP